MPTAQDSLLDLPFWSEPRSADASECRIASEMWSFICGKEALLNSLLVVARLADVVLNGMVVDDKERKGYLNPTSLSLSLT